LKSNPDHPALPYLLLATSTAIWAGNFIIGRLMPGDIPPMTLNFWRWTAATVIFLVLAAPKLKSELHILQQHWKWLVMLTLTGVVFFHALVYTGLRSTTVVNAGLMMATNPIVIPPIAWVIHRDKLTRQQFAGLMVSLLGVAVIVTRADISLIRTLTFNTGDLLLLAAVPLWGIYSVLLKDRPKELSATVLLVAIACLGTLLMLPLYLWELNTMGGIVINAANLASIGYVAIFASVVAYFCWNGGVARIGAIKAGPFLHLLPVFSALFAMLFLGERLEAYHIPGIALIGVGIGLTVWRGREAQAL